VARVQEGLPADSTVLHINWSSMKIYIPMYTNHIPSLSRPSRWDPPHQNLWADFSNGAVTCCLHTTCGGQGRGFLRLGSEAARGYLATFAISCVLRTPRFENLGYSLRTLKGTREHLFLNQTAVDNVVKGGIERTRYIRSKLPWRDSPPESRLAHFVSCSVGGMSVD